MRLKPCLVVSAPSAGVSNVREVKNVQLLFQREVRVREMDSFDQGPLLPSAYLGRQNVIHVIIWTGLPPLFLQAIKNWMVGRPGNEAMCKSYTT